MDRLACIDLPAFPLQLLMRREPAWARLPVAVVEEDKPGGKILWVNEAALRMRILPGMRYASGLALAADLCAGVVSPAIIQEGIERVLETLHAFSPDVEPAPDEPGVFWVNASGLLRLHRSLRAWARGVRKHLLELGFESRVVVGFTRFGTYAVVRGGHDQPVVVLDSAGSESKRMRNVPLSRLGLDPAVRDTMHTLGILTVGQFLELPAGGLRKRFGEAAYRLHELARGERFTPLQPHPEHDSLARRSILDDPESDSTRLIFLIKTLVHPMLDALAARGQALVELTIELELDGAGTAIERLRPAEPTLDARQLMNLVHLRLEASPPAAPVCGVSVDAVSMPATSEQLSLFFEKPRRNLRMARRAFARLRAELGEGAVVRAELREGHLPEASYGWTPIDAVDEPAPCSDRPRRLVRRVYARPLALPHRPRHEEDGWLLRGRSDVAVDTMVGPYIVSGGWWRTEVHREYHFVRNLRGEWLWIFYDRRRQRWFLHGRVE